MRIVIASSNRYKIKEIEQIYAELPIEFIPMSAFSNIPKIEEDGKSFRENAIKKAQVVSKALELITLAEDSGIEVDALNGGPGIYSSRYAGKERDDRKNNEKLLNELAGVPLEKRTARYRAVAVLMSAQQIEAIAEGTMEGIIAERPRGESGFGYDPIFIVPAYGKTVAELGTEIKNKISHRAKALRSIKENLKTLLCKQS